MTKPTRCPDCLQHPRLRQTGHGIDLICPVCGWEWHEGEREPEKLTPEQRQKLINRIHGTSCGI